MTDNRYINKHLPKLQFDKMRNRVKYCPCGKDNKDGKFSPYIGYENKGYCHSCGETFLPELSKKEPFPFPEPIRQRKQETPKPVSFIPVDIFKKSLKHYTENTLVMFFKELFNIHGEGAEITQRLIEKYFIGTSKYWNGATVFWQIARDGVRDGKIIQYKTIPYEISIIGRNCKRIQTNIPPVYWVHKELKIKNYKQCLVGEHLLYLPGNENKIIAIFESEKTAGIASVYFVDYICLACGGLNGLSNEKCKVLRGRNVILYPDLSKPKPGNLSAYKIWIDKANELCRLYPGTRFNVSDLLERKATEDDRQQGLDLADYLIRLDYKEFQQQEQPKHNSIKIKSEQNTYNLKKFFAYIDSTTKKLFIEVSQKKEEYFVYPNVDYYNNRSCMPVVVLKKNINLQKCKKVDLDIESLTIKI